MTDPLTTIREWAEDTLKRISVAAPSHQAGYRHAAGDVLAILNVTEAEQAIATGPMTTLDAVLHKEHANDWNLSCPLCVQEMMEVLREEGEEDGADDQEGSTGQSREGAS